MANLVDVLLSRGVDTIYFLGGEDKIYDRNARCLGYLYYNQWVLYPKPMGPAIDSMRKRILGEISISSSVGLSEYSLIEEESVFLFTMLYGTNIEELKASS